MQPERPVLRVQPPKYGLVMDELRARISDGAYRVGSRVPSEPELQQEFRVSRVTVRRAIEELAREGLLRKEQGRGTYVRRPEITHTLNTLVGVTETMYSMGVVPEDIDLQLFREPVPPKIAAPLSLEPGTEVWHLVRRRGADGVPINLTDNYTNPRLVPGMSRDVLLPSLYATYERIFGLTLAKGEEIVEAKAADEIEASHLEVRRGAPILVVTRVTFLDTGEPIEVAIVRSRSDRYRYSITLHGRPMPALAPPVARPRPTKPCRGSRRRT